MVDIEEAGGDGVNEYDSLTVIDGDDSVLHPSQDHAEPIVLGAQRADLFLKIIGETVEGTGKPICLRIENQGCPLGEIASRVCFRYLGERFQLSRNLPLEEIPQYESEYRRDDATQQDDFASCLGVVAEMFSGEKAESGSHDNDENCVTGIETPEQTTGFPSL